MSLNFNGMRVVVLLLVLSFYFSVGLAQKSDSLRKEKRVVPWFVERFKISAGFFYVVNNTNIQVGITGSPGTDIQLEKDLGFNAEVGTFLANFQWRISSRSRLTFNYVVVDRSSFHTLDKDLVFAGNTYPVNSLVSTYFNTAIYQFSYGYALISKPKLELGLLIGAHVVGTLAGISTVGNAMGSNVSNNFGITAPIPDLGIWGGYAFSNHFAVNFDLEYLSLTVGTYSGRLLSSNLTCTYRLVGKLDLSLGYTGLNYRVANVKNEVTGVFKCSYNGPVLGVNFSFGKRSWKHLPGLNF